MGILSWLILGLIVGALARLVIPGKGPRGILTTAAVGICGAFLGGLIGAGIGLGSVQGFDLTSIFLATVGSVVLLLIYRALAGRPSDE